MDFVVFLKNSVELHCFVANFSVIIMSSDGWQFFGGGSKLHFVPEFVLEHSVKDLWAVSDIDHFIDAAT